MLKKEPLEEVEYLYELVREGRIDAYDVDLTKLVEAFKEKAESLKEADLLPLAGRFLLASVKIMKLKLEYFFPPVVKQRERKKITIEEVKEVLEGDIDLYEYVVPVGRPKGSKTQKVSVALSEPEDVPLHKDWRIEDYMRFLVEKNLLEWEEFERFFYSLKDKLERVRFFMAWLSLS